MLSQDSPLFDTAAMASFLGTHIDTSDIDVASQDYNIDHLDYTYVASCPDTKELRKLLAVLRSGNEGSYPQLEQAIIDRLGVLDPKFKPAPEPTPINKTDLVLDIAAWTKEMKSRESALKSSSNKKTTINLKSRSDEPKTIDITYNNNNTEKTEPTTTTTTPSQRIKSSDYRSWDRFNIDQEIAKLDQQDTTTTTTTPSSEKTKLTTPRPAPKSIPTTIKPPPTASIEELKYLSELEKTKGNESLKSGDIEESITYYTRSIAIFPLPNVYTNRSLAYTKLKEYAKAESDATEALRFADVTYRFKAYLRRGTARSKRGMYRFAILDFLRALRIKPDAVDVVRVKDETVKKYFEVEGVNAPVVVLPEDDDGGVEEVAVVGVGNNVKEVDAKKETTKPKKKLVIEEVEEDEVVEEEDDEVVEIPVSSNISGFKRMPIIEVEEDEEDEEIEEIVTPAARRLGYQN